MVLVALAVVAAVVVWAGPRVASIARVALDDVHARHKTPAAAGGAELNGLTVTDLDGVPAWPMPLRLVFNTIKYPADSHEAVHDTATTRLANHGKKKVKVTALTVSGPFKLVTPAKLPVTVKPGGHVDVTIRFTADSGAAKGSVQTGSLNLRTAAGSSAGTTIALAGWWQLQSEHNLEPSVHDLTTMFGLNVALPSSFYGRGAVHAFSTDEVLSPYWRRLDPGRPVTIDELASWYHYGVASTLTWFAEGSRTRTPWATTGKYQSQTVLPRTASGTDPDALSSGSIDPDGAFGFRIDNQSSDPTLNSQTADRAAGCKSTTCGNYVRAFQLHAADGSPLSGTYLITEDDGGAQPNYDYNDHVYILSNVRPAS